MTGGIRRLRFIQLGAETTAGTATTATTIWRGLGTAEDRLTLEMPDEDIGYVSGGNRSYIPKTLSALPMDATPLTYEQLPYLFNAHIANATPAADGSGSGYIYAYTWPTTAPSTKKTYTLEYGDNQQGERAAYGFARRVRLAGNGGEAWMMEAEWLSHGAAPATKTASLSLPTVEDSLFGKTSLYIDAVSTTIGTTQKTHTLLAAEIISEEEQPSWTADDIDFDEPSPTAPTITLALTIKHDGSAVSEIAAWRAQTPRQIRILNIGSALTTAGTSYSYKTFLLDAAGKWERFEKIGERDGNDITVGRFRARYDSTADLFCEAIVVNELSALP